MLAPLNSGSSVNWQRGLSEIMAHFVQAHYSRRQLAVAEFEDWDFLIKFKMSTRFLYLF